MAAASAVAPYDGHHDSEYLDRKTLPLRTGLHDSECLFIESKWRCDALCMQRDPTGETFTPISSLVQVSDSSGFRSASDLTYSAASHLPLASSTSTDLWSSPEIVVLARTNVRMVDGLWNFRYSIRTLLSRLHLPISNLHLMLLLRTPRLICGHCSKMLIALS